MPRLIEKITQLPKSLRLELLEILQQSIGHSARKTHIEVMPQKDVRGKDSSKNANSKVKKNKDSLEDYHLITTLWGKGESLAIPEVDIYTLFINRAQRFLNKKAISMGTESISYQELIEKVEHLSAILKQKYSLTPQSHIIIYLPRSINMVVAILATLKLGCVYVPLDITQPIERSNKILAASESVMIITHSNLKQLDSNGIPVFFLEPQFDMPLGKCNAAPYEKVLSTHLMYIIYTSGTTGVPKGVMIEHQSVINFVLSMIRSFDITYLDKIIFFASVSFDVSVFEIFTTLVAGAELVIASDEEKASPILLTKLLNNTKVTVAELPPAILPLLNPNDFPSLRLLSVGGEKFSGDVIRSWVNPSRRIINGYGPTETTVAVTIYDYRGQQEKIPAIGRPIANHSVYVITKNNQLASVGTIGELYVAGLGVARGYYHHEKLTKEKFVYLTIYGEKIRAYKTGDLVRWRRDGYLEFVGRIDRQVKIRGHRIELGEIETALLSHPKIKQAVVSYEYRQINQPILVAYVVLVGSALDSKEIYKWLSNKLPNYMLPSYIAFIDTIPLTANGKVDYDSLSEAPLAASVDSLKSLEPFNDTQLVIQKIFIDYLGNVSIGLRDNFFHMGGNSLLAAQVTNAVANTLGYPLKIMDFLQYPTIYDLSMIISSKHRKLSSSQQLEHILKTIQSPWLIFKENKKASRYLVYFHCAGGSCAQIAHWQKKLDSAIQLVGIQLPGHDQRLQENAINNLEKLSKLIAPELESLSDKPLYFMGHSMGALLAYAVAKELSIKQQHPKLLIVIASRAPQNPPTKVFDSQLSDHGFLRQMQAIGGLSNDLLDNEELMFSLLPGMRADVIASETFFSNSKIFIPIVAMIGKKDKVSPSEAVLAWEELNTKGFEKYFFSGDHFFIQEQEDVFISVVNNLLV